MSFGGNATSGLALAANTAGSNIKVNNIKVNNNNQSFNISSANQLAGFTNNSFSNIIMNNNLSYANFGNINRCVFSDLSINNNGSYVLYFSGAGYDSANNTVNKLYASLNAASLYLYGLTYTTFNTMLLNRNGLGTANPGMLINFCNNNTFNDVSILNCSLVASIQNQSTNNTFNNLDTSSNNSGVFQITAGGGSIYLNNSKISDINNNEFLLPVIYSGSKLFSQNHNKIPNNHRIYADQGNILTDASIIHGTSIYSWKMTPINASCNLSYPLELNISKIACTGGTTTNVKTWFKTTFDNSIGGYLMCKENDMLGIYQDISVHTTAATNWQQLSINITPTITGVVEIVAGVYLKAPNVVANAGTNLWVDDMTIT